MPYTLNNAPVTGFGAMIPERGNWTARVQLSTDTVFTKGQAVTFVVEDATFAGTIIRGGPFLSRASYLIVGGAGAWRLAVGPGALRSDGGIRLSAAADKLLSAVNMAAITAGLQGRERLTVQSDRTLGPASTRVKMTGAAVLDILGAWYMQPDGTTVIGTRPAPTIAAPVIVIEDYTPDDERVDVSVPSGEIAAFLAQMGGSVSGAPLEAPVAFKSCAVNLDGGKLRFTVNP